MVNGRKAEIQNKKLFLLEKRKQTNVLEAFIVLINRFLSSGKQKQSALVTIDNGELSAEEG